MSRVKRKSDGSGKTRRGVPASPGIAIGPAFVVRRERLVVPEYRIEPTDAEREVARLVHAVRETRADLDRIRSGMGATGLVRDVFDAQLLFLEDPTLREAVIGGIRNDHRNAEWALQRELARVQAVLEGAADPYIRERSGDVSSIVRRVLESLMGRETSDLGNAPSGVVVVAEDLSPADLLQIAPENIAGLAIDASSRTSHVAILARSLEIPALVGVEGSPSRTLADGQMVILDGRTGRLVIDADADEIAEAKRQRDEYVRLTGQLLRYADLPAETRDGVEVQLNANVDLREEIPGALRYGAEGIGLYRTEFLFMNRSDLPSEDEQLATYREIVEAVAPRSAVIRTLDLGGDKMPSGLGLSDEANPALGLRGIRLSQSRPELFTGQLRALLRASAHGRLKILLPMVSGIDEVEFALAELARVRQQLEGEGIPVAPVEVGVMIETPAAALIADLIAPRIDFLSLGTNDLLQYTLAVDRENEQVAYLYEPLHPAVLRLIQRVAQAGRRAGIRVGMCGEMAGDPMHTWILIALGLSELSMSSASIPLLKKIVRESTLAEARELLAEVLRLRDADEIRERIRKEMTRRFSHEFEGLLATG